MTNPKLDRQFEIEAIMTDKGRERFRREFDMHLRRKDASESSVGRQFTKHTVETVEAGVIEFFEKANTGRAGRKHTAYNKLKDVNPGVLAYLTCKAVFNAIIFNHKWAFTASQIGTLVEDEARLSEFFKREPKRYKWVQRQISERAIRHRHQQRQFFNVVMKSAEIPWKSWTRSEHLIVGEKLLDIFVQTTGFIRPVTVQEGGKTVHKIEATEEIAERIRKGQIKGELLRPYLLPCVIPPAKRKGKALVGSGYHSGIVPKKPVVKRMRDSHFRSVRRAKMDVVSKTITALDGTAFTIEKRTLDVLKTLWEKGHQFGDLPSKYDKPNIPHPSGFTKEQKHLAKDWVEKNKDAHISWRKAQRAVYEYNAKSLSKRMLVERVIEIADLLKDEPELYFPHEMDFRGRIYDVPVGLNPQGPDFARGLLVFAEGKYVNNRQALEWLMIHGANTFGEDKISLADRIQWVRDNQDRIEAVYRDPYENMWWTEADKPFSFLTWVYDYCGVVLEGRPSRVPVALDGSCNGLQHLSAMLLDPVGGAAVNLVPSDVPADIYQEVANVVTKKLEAAEGDWIAETWLAFGIDRKMCKRPTMVMPYGGQLLSTMDYVEDAYRERLGDNPSPFGDRENEMKALTYLGKLVFESIREVVQKAAVAMQWLQEVAKVAVEANVPLRWTTPAGYVVEQAYYSMRKAQIETHLSGRISRISYQEESDKLNRSQMVNGIAPNFVHSMDAAALQLTVCRGLEAGITNFSMIHDSYGTHAADTSALAAILREVFVDIYSGDVLEQFRKDVIASLPPKLRAKVPPVPEKGTLDITEVLRSDFFFA